MPKKPASRNMPLVRSAVLSNYVGTALTLELDPKLMLEEHSITTSMLNNPDTKISALVISRLLEASAARTGVENFALHMVQGHRLSVLGHLGLAAREAPTVKQLLQFLFRHMHTHNEALTYSLEQDTKGVCITQHCFIPGANQSQRQMREAGLGGIVRILRIFLGSTWVPAQTFFAHSRPGELKLHRALFGNSIAFDAHFDAITFAADDLDTPIAGSNSVIAGYANQLWHKTQRLKLGTVRSSMRQLIVILLPAGRCTLQAVAHELMLEPRTLQRRLQEEHTSFSVVVDDIREKLLDQFIQRSQHQLSDIASLLGFSQLSAFSRWHKNRFGCTAQERRMRMRSNVLSTS